MTRSEIRGAGGRGARIPLRFIRATQLRYRLNMVPLNPGEKYVMVLPSGVV